MAEDIVVKLQALETLPQVFSHFDSQRRNLFIRKGSDEQDELVLIDWAFCGPGPLGAELFALVLMSATLSEWPPARLAQLDAAVFGRYLHGLAEEQLYVQWLPLLSYSLDCADEARLLLKKLGLL